MYPPFANTYYNADYRLVPGSLVWWAASTPFKIFTAGGEAVVVFFVLSGLVLALPVLQRRGEFDWIAYYPQRVARLWLPVTASVLLAAIWILLAPQAATSAYGKWVESYATPHLTWNLLVEGMDLLSGVFLVNNPVWSLQWEIIFSLALPLFLGFAILARRKWAWVCIGVVVLTWVGIHISSTSLTYLPTFIVGTIIAVNLSDLKRLIAWVNQRSTRHLIWGLALMLSLLGLILVWLIGPIPNLESLSELTKAIQPLAAGVIVVVCMGWTFMERVLTAAFLQWAGRISFSLYLIHVPILLFVRFALPHAPLQYVIAAGILFSLMIAWLFYRFVEARAHRFSRWFGSRVSRGFVSLDTRVR